MAGPNYARMCLIVLLSTWMMILFVHGCSVEYCNREYRNQLAQYRQDQERAMIAATRRQQQQRSRMTKSSAAGPNLSQQQQQNQRINSCVILINIQQCMKALSRQCRGDLNYHSLLVLLKARVEQRNCTGSLPPATSGPTLGGGNRVNKNLDPGRSRFASYTDPPPPPAPTRAPKARNGDRRRKQRQNRNREISNPYDLPNHLRVGQIGAKPFPKIKNAAASTFSLNRLIVISLLYFILR